MANGGVYLEIDVSDLKDRINTLKSAMKPKQFERAMYGIFRETGNRVKKILGEDVPQDYMVTKTQVRKTVGSPRLTSSGLGVGCSIPIRGARRGIGPGRDSYSASGSARGWESKTKKYRVKAKILRSTASTLPAAASGYGGYPPFRNTLATKLNNQTYTGTGDNVQRRPIEKMAGIAIPQMPMNRSQEEVQWDIKMFMERRMDNRLQALIRNGK